MGADIGKCIICTPNPKEVDSDMDSSKKNGEYVDSDTVSYSSGPESDDTSESESQSQSTSQSQSQSVSQSESTSQSQSQSQSTSQSQSQSDSDNTIKYHENNDLENDTNILETYSITRKNSAKLREEKIKKNQKDRISRKLKLIEQQSLKNDNDMNSGKHPRIPSMSHIDQATIQLLTNKKNVEELFGNTERMHIEEYYDDDLPDINNNNINNNNNSNSNNNIFDITNEIGESVATKPDEIDISNLNNLNHFNLFFSNNKSNPASPPLNIMTYKQIPTTGVLTTLSKISESTNPSSSSSNHNKINVELNDDDDEMDDELDDEETVARQWMDLHKCNIVNMNNNDLPITNIENGILSLNTDMSSDQEQADRDIKNWKQRLSQINSNDILNATQSSEEDTYNINNINVNINNLNNINNAQLLTPTTIANWNSDDLNNQVRDMQNHLEYMKQNEKNEMEKQFIDLKQKQQQSTLQNWIPQ